MSILQSTPEQIINRTEHLTDHYKLCNKDCNCEYFDLNSTGNHNHLNFKFLTNIIEYCKLDSQCKEYQEKNKAISEQLIINEKIRKSLEALEETQVKYNGGYKQIKYRTLPKLKHFLRDRDVCKNMSQNNKAIANISETYLKYQTRIGQIKNNTKIINQEKRPQYTFFNARHLGDIGIKYNW